MPDQRYLAEVVLRMSDGTEAIVLIDDIISVDLDRDLIPVEVGPYRSVAPGRTAITIKAWVGERFAGRSPRDVTPQPIELPGRTKRLPPHA